MKVRKILSALLCLGLLLTILAGCGGSSLDSINRAPAEAPALKQEMENSMAADTALGSAAPDGSTALPENRKWVITVDMYTETEDLDGLLAALDQTITGLGGYVEGQNIYNGSTYADRRYRNADLTVRVPAESVDRFTGDLEGMSNVVRKNKHLEDITLNYVDTESRVAALKTEEARLLEFMAQAETMADLLEIESRLTDVRYELERYTSRLRTYDNQVDYATIHLNIEEVQEYTPVAEKTTWQRITEGFADSVDDLGDSLVELVVWLIVSSPFLLVYGGGAVVIFLLVRKLRKKAKAKKAAKKIATPEPPAEETK